MKNNFSIKYDSVLFGNGLTLHLLNNIYKSLDINNNFRELLFFNIFLQYFIKVSEHTKIKRSFYKYFNITNETIANHKKAHEFINNNINEIIRYGLERWVSKYIFEGNKIPKEISHYIYILYNYWCDLIDTQYFNLRQSKYIIECISNQIRNRLNDNNSIFTTNFDTVFDLYLRPKHLHGKFITPLIKILDIILDLKNENEFGG